MTTPPSSHPFADLIGLQFQSLEAGRSTCSVEVGEALMNPQGVVHGAVLYALADTGMGGAVYPTLEPGELCATIEIKISYFRAVRGGTLQCETTMVHRGRRVAALQSTIQSEGATVASATGSYSIFRPRA